MAKGNTREENDNMSKIALNILSTVIAAGIIANVAFAWRVSERLTRIEYQLGIQKPIAQLSHE